MYSIMKQNGKEAAHIMEYIVDAIDEVEDLPTDCSVGSIVIVASTSQVFILNNVKKWVEL